MTALPICVPVLGFNAIWIVASMNVDFLKETLD